MDNFTLDDEQLDKINKLTRRKFSVDELYAFPIVLCDNEVDRDGERFSIKALKQLASLFVGKTGIFDHNPKGENQTARIYQTEVVTDSSKKTSAGEDYTYLSGYAYMIRTEKNTDLIKEIDGGIKKEVSVSCAVKDRLCSICGKNQNAKSCSHINGKIYNGKKCCHILDNAYDAYEFSFVAIPAQPRAGVAKKYCSKASVDGEAKTDSESNSDKTLKQIALSTLLLEMPDVSRSVIEKLCDRLSYDELRDTCEEIRSKQRGIKFLDEILRDSKKLDSSIQNFKM